ncbi:MAG: T9SS type A sorting domain-containing protein [Bacteroidetes bacterium]|nr:T9SS type A sorting domain-containing protein [Bacteroidota bacterium]MBS1974417.1 T9SS type A sorting domain-containing protein [Bacteroidota bacterium]
MRRLVLLTFLVLAQLFLFAQDVCHTADYRQRFFLSHPEAVPKMAELESFTQNIIAQKKFTASRIKPVTNKPDVISIPVVVHVLYGTDQENISDAQVQSQIDVLNQDYQRRNADTTKTPDVFKSVAADCGFQFVLAKVDPGGYATTGIIHKKTNVQSFGIQDGIKFSSSGGDDAWDRDRYLNIWVGNLSGSVLGYSSVVSGPAANDGVVILYTAFGTKGTATAPYNKGRTTTHEVGHWLNLIHTWGDADCGDDHVSDTPPQSSADRGCPGGVVISCNNAPTGNMYQNFMDFTNDECMNLFTIGQRERMLALFQPGGARYALLSSTAIMATPLSKPIPTVAEGGTSSISVYPNPSVDHITVKLSEDISMGSQMDIYNQVGQKVVSMIVQQSQFQVNIADLGKGIYFIKVNGGKCRVMTKLMKL